MKFSITILDDWNDIGGERTALGTLTIGDFVEQLRCPVEFWDVQCYRQQWDEGIKRLLDGHERSAIITSMRNPETANFIFWWVMYAVEDEVLIENHVLFLDELDFPFNPSDPYASIPALAPPEPGEPAPSQWRLPIAAMRDFLGDRR